MRCPQSKLTTVKALQSIGYQTIASGDSYNDLGMIQASKAGFLFKSTDKIRADYPDIPPMRNSTICWPPSGAPWTEDQRGGSSEWTSNLTACLLPGGYPAAPELRSDEMVRGGLRSVYLPAGVLAAGGGFVGAAPSALRLILPESCLDGPNVETDIVEVNNTMTRYLREGPFRTLTDSLIYVERRLDNGKVRRGLMGMVDLEQYDYEPGSPPISGPPRARCSPAFRPGWRCGKTPRWNCPT